jgi:aryl-alcohol dehydrogenase-like predicted oxidoreductase
MIEDLAKEKSATPAQIALQWVLAKGHDIVPIPGTKRLSYLEDNLGALKVTLTAHEREALDMAFPLGVAKGDRYPAAAMAAVNL